MNQDNRSNEIDCDICDFKTISKAEIIDHSFSHLEDGIL